MKYYAYKSIKFSYIDLLFLSITCTSLIYNTIHSDYTSALIYLGIFIMSFGSLFTTLEIQSKTLKEIFQAFHNLQGAQALQEIRLRKIKFRFEVIGILILLLGLSLKFT